MAAEKNSFIMYNEWEKHFALLENEEIGELMRAIFAYAKDKTIIEITSSSVKMAFSFISAQMDRDSSAWEGERQARSDAGKIGGLKSGERRSKRSSASKNNQNEANEAMLNLLNQNEANEAVNVNVNVNVNDDVNTTTPLPPSGDTPPAITLTFDKDGQCPIAQDQIDEWQNNYPMVDVPYQLKRIQNWFIGNPYRCKSIPEVQSFIINWLERVVNIRGSTDGRNSKNPDPEPGEPPGKLGIHL